MDNVTDGILRRKAKQRRARNQLQVTNEDLFVIYHIEGNCFVALSNPNLPLTATIEKDSPAFTRLSKIQANDTHARLCDDCSYPTDDFVAFETKVVNGDLQILSTKPIRLPIL